MAFAAGVSISAAMVAGISAYAAITSLGAGTLSQSRASPGAWPWGAWTIAEIMILYSILPHFFLFFSFEEDEEAGVRKRKKKTPKRFKVWN